MSVLSVFNLSLPYEDEEDCDSAAKCCSVFVGAQTCVLNYNTSTNSRQSLLPINQSQDLDFEEGIMYTIEAILTSSEDGIRNISYHLLTNYTSGKYTYIHMHVVVLQLGGRIVRNSYSVLQFLVRREVEGLWVQW